MLNQYIKECARLNGPKKEFNDKDCSYEYEFLCQKDERCPTKYSKGACEEHDKKKLGNSASKTSVEECAQFCRETAECDSIEMGKKIIIYIANK